MKKFLVVLILIPFLLASCTSLSSNSGALSDLQQFTLADLNQALADANAHNDQAASQCYSTLIAVINEGLPDLPPKPIGAISAFQALRDIIGQGPGKADAIAKRINLGCAALFVDANFTLAKLLAIGAGSVIK